MRALLPLAILWALCVGILVVSLSEYQHQQQPMLIGAAVIPTAAPKAQRDPDIVCIHVLGRNPNRISKT